MSKQSLGFALRFAIFSLVLAICALVLHELFQYSVRCGGGRAENAIIQNGSRPTVIIDAGHGGEDGGASSASGIVEKDLNLKIAFELRDYLTLCGVDCVLTREDDRLLYTDYIKGTLKRQDLNNRLAVSREYPDAVFISIHMNTFPDVRCRGLQIYYSPNEPSSADIARAVQSAVKERLQPDNNRRTKPAGSSIFLLNRIESPALLIECGFLSNEAESAALADDISRRSLAFVIGDAICGWFAGADGSAGCLPPQ
ncbi:MAG: N-acetylmuramoyl-L-alanine amidase [Eubacteriales bacterium]